MPKVHVISGFLGAGKTTLIKYLVQGRQHRGRLAIIENEFGQVGLDGVLLADQDFPVRELNAGCICCTLAGDFKTDLQKLIEQYRPDEIIVEPSGVGQLSDIKQAVAALRKENLTRQPKMWKTFLQKAFARKPKPVVADMTSDLDSGNSVGAKNTLHTEADTNIVVPQTLPEQAATPSENDLTAVSLGALITVVDGKKCRQYLQNFAAFYQDQIANATELLVTRTEMLTHEQKQILVHTLRNINPDARLHLLSLTKLDPQQWNDVLLDGKESQPRSDWQEDAVNEAELEALRDQACLDERLLEMGYQSTSGKLTSKQNSTIARTENRGSFAEKRQESAAANQQENPTERQTTDSVDRLRATDVFSAQGYSLRSCSAATAEALRVSLQAESLGRIVRFKGICPTTSDGQGPWLHLEYAGGEWQRSEITPRERSLFIFIGTTIQRPAIEAFFDAHDIQYVVVNKMDDLQTFQ